MAQRDPLVIIDGEIQQLPTGDTLSAAQHGGALTIRYQFNTSTANADPGSGKLSLDNATQLAAIRMNVSDTDVGSADWQAALATMDDTTSTVKGYIRIVHETDYTKWLLFGISAYTAQTGYAELTISGQDGSAASPFANDDPVIFTFTMKGDKGDTGATGQGVPAGGTAGQVLSKIDGTDYNTQWSDPSGGSGTSYDIQIFAASGTWTKPANATTVHVTCIGGGGGGGSGRRGASSTTRGGGGGGAGGGYSYDSFDESTLSATETVTVGTGGAGGAATTTDNTNGNAGSAGGNTTFGAHLTANGGGGGAAGTNAGGGTGGTGGTGAGTVSEAGGDGADGSSQIDGASPANKLAGAGGGSGGGLTAANGNTGSSDGGTSGGVGGEFGLTVFNAVTGTLQSFPGNPGLGGATVLAAVRLVLCGGGGGGGGVSSIATAGICSGYGGKGGQFGGGGAGSGATLNGLAATSRGGGDGGDGVCVVVTELSA